MVSLFSCEYDTVDGSTGVYNVLNSKPPPECDGTKSHVIRQIT